MDTLANVSTPHSDVPAQAAELARLREIINQLSYVLHGLSHDLREPIRTITCYTTLLQQQDGIGANQDTLEYLHFVSGAAQRLQALTAGILEWAEMLKSEALVASEVDMNFALQTALANLQLPIEESHAAVVHDQLPIVRGSSVQLSQLFQNLVSNAIKYRSAAPPRNFHKCGVAGWRLAIFHQRQRDRH